MVGAHGKNVRRLVVRGGAVVGEMTTGRMADLAAIDIFEAAVGDFPGALTGGAPVVDCPGVVFRRTVLPVGIEASLNAGPGTFDFSLVARHNGAWVAAPDNCDHMIVDGEWFALERESWESARAWLRQEGDGGLISYLSFVRPDESVHHETIDRLSETELVSEAFSYLPPPESLAAELYPHQMTGFRWLLGHAMAGSGCILADEMGLGKTIQAIATVVARRDAGYGPSLIVCPLTLTENWRREILRFAPGLRLYRHLGSNRARRPQAIREVDIVITSYDTAVIDRAVLGGLSWDLVIIDEAQNIKNRATNRWEALQGLHRRSGIAMTGTPVENRSSDLWAIAEFSVPGYMGSFEQFEQEFATDPSSLKRAVRPILLRREIGGVGLALPPLIRDDVALEMFERERSEHQRFVAELTAMQTNKLAILTKMRMFAAHPHAVGRLLDLSPTDACAKLTRLVEMAEELLGVNGKGLVFVAFLDAADLIASTLRSRLQVPVWTLDGRLPMHQRQLVLDQFATTKTSAFLVANPIAAGVGLNVQAANHVFHYTPEWNPAREDQATARAWRSGQTRTVVAHRLYYVDSVDEAIVDLVNTKRAISQNVLEHREPSGAEIASLLAAAVRFATKGRSEWMEQGTPKGE